MQLEPGLVVPGLERPVVAEYLVYDGQHVVRAGAVVRGRVAAAAAGTAHCAVVLVTRNGIHILITIVVLL